jgi:hypothetical protein
MTKQQINAAELIRLVNRIKKLENTLVRIAMLADSDEFESQEINAIWMLATEATTEKSSAVQSTSSGGPGGASTYGGKGLGIAGATWPPETRITVNGKTFCLADIDKEMTE